MSQASDVGAGGMLPVKPREKDRIRGENDRAQSASTTLKWVCWMLAALLALSMMVNLTYARAVIYTFPIKRWIWTSDARAVCDARPLWKPTVAPARVKDYAAGAAVELFSFDYLNNGRVLSAATDRYTTPAGRVNFYNVLQESHIVDYVQKNYMSLESVVTGAPYISKEGVRPEDNRYYWNVQVPVRMFYYTLGDKKADERVMDMVVVQVDPSLEHQNGIAVDGVRSTQMTLVRRPQDQ